MLRSNALQRSSSSDTVASSPNDSEVSSLFDVARGSPSPGSASSDTDDSLDDVASKKAMSGKPIDTYGNEFQVPTFTMKEIHAAIPARCFERSIAMGLYYFARDLVLLGTAFAICHRYITPENIPSTLVRGVMWALYTFVQGLFGTGLWIIGHECGHGALMPSKTLNNSVGFVAHSILLAPFFSWKLSHSRHHKATGHMERDMAFLPRTREQYASRVGVMAHQLADMGEETPLAAAINLLGQQVAGFPLYLMTNFTGNDNHESQPEGRGKGKHNGFFTGVNHFNPSSPLYKNSEASSIVLSDLGLAAVVAIMSVVAMKNSWADVAVWYIIPWMWVNSWIGKLVRFSTFSTASSAHDHCF
jgi:omega-6 fatty acid desaturase (delta-12 desaturase)